MRWFVIEVVMLIMIIKKRNNDEISQINSK